MSGVGEAPADRARCTVFINDFAFEVAFGPFNVRQAFGDEAMLIQSTGHPVPIDEWGVTLQPLQHGAYYYLVCIFLLTLFLNSRLFSKLSLLMIET